MKIFGTQTQFKYLIIFGILLSTSSAAFDVALAEESNIKKGEQLFSSGKFDDAAKCYKAELEKNPKNSMAHYMLGAIFIKTDRPTEAGPEFVSAKELDPQGAIGKYSEQYLQVLKNNNKAIPSKATIKDDSAASKDTVNAPKTAASQTAEHINQYAHSASSALSDECDKEVERTNNEANKNIQQLTVQMEKSLDEIVRTRLNNGVYQDKAIHAEFEGRMKTVKEEAERKVAEIKAHYRVKQDAIEDAALSMHKSYEQKNQVGKIILSPVGSNMHVRNYQTSDEPSGDALPVVAAPAKALPKK